MNALILLVLIIVFAAIAYMLGYTKALKVCNDKINKSNQNAKYFKQLLYKYILNDINILKEFNRLVLNVHEMNSIERSQFNEIISYYINGLEENYKNANTNTDQG